MARTDTPQAVVDWQQAFRNYARHQPDCVSQRGETHCSCGFRELHRAACAPVQSERPNPARDWPEDSNFENGNYQNRCVYCGNLFTGYKRRQCCKLCFVGTTESTKT